MTLSDRTRRLAIPLAAFLLGLLMLGVTAVVTLTPASRPAGSANVGGPFTLVDQDGRAVTDRSFLGQPHLVFFGFTHCPTSARRSFSRCPRRCGRPGRRVEG